MVGSGKLIEKETPMKLPTNDVTRRDAYIIGRALTCAIFFIDRLPPEQRPLSDQKDMKALLDDMMEHDDDLALLTADWMLERR